MRGDFCVAKNRKAGNSARQRWKFITAAVASLSIVRAASASSTDYWNDGSSNWSNPNNWNPAQVPGANDTVNVISTLGLSQTITYDYTNSAVYLNSLNIDSTGGAGTGSFTLSMTANDNLYGGNEYVGNSGNGAFIQSNGFNGLFNGSSLFVGANTGATGTYSLSAGGYLQDANGFEYVGYFGTGNFNQSGGTNSANIVDVGYSGRGTYSFSGGTALGFGNVIIGDSGVGVYNQSGGASYLYNGHNLILGNVAGSMGTYDLGGTGSFNVVNNGDGGGYEYVGYNGTGNFNQSGGTNTTGFGGLQIGVNANSTGTYTLSGNGALVAGGGYSGNNEYVGVAGTGTFTQTGGTNTITSNNLLEIGYSSGSNGVYSLSGTGSLSVGANEYVGDGGAGVFNQSGGTNEIGNNSALVLGYQSGATGTYNLSGTGALLASGGETIGFSGTGLFNQSGGSNVIGSGYNLDIGLRPGVTGTYILSGTGALTVNGSESIGGEGLGVFNQSGGTNWISGGLILSDPVNAQGGTYNLSGGSAMVYESTTYVGGYNGTLSPAGVLTVSGTGVLNAQGGLVIYNSPGSVVNLSGGTIATPYINVNGVTSLFNWSSGTLDLTGSITFDPTAPPTSTSVIFGSSLSLGANQSLVVGGNETLGGGGPFNLTLNNGSGHYVGGNIILNTGSSLTQNIGSSLYYGSFFQDGGTVNGQLQNQGTFYYSTGLFNARLVNQGTVYLGPSFTAALGVENEAAMTVGLSQTLTVNGQGLDNLGSFALNGGVISGTGQVLNDFGGTMSASGTINPPLVNDGVLNVTGALTLTAPATNNGVLNVTPGAVVSQLTLNNYGVIEGGGSISGGVSNGSGGVIDADNPSAPLQMPFFQGNLPGGIVEVGAGSLLSLSNPWTNSGLVTLEGGGALLQGSAITNNTTIQGAGIISPAVLNNAGVIRAQGGELDLAGSGNTNGSSGQIQAATGGTVVYVQGLTSNAGTIALSGGTFDNNNAPMTNSVTGNIAGFGTFNTGGLTNNGAITIGGAASIEHGNIVNEATATFAGSTFIYGNITNFTADNVIIAGTTPNQLYGTFSNSGTLTVAASASGYLYGAYTGTGSIKNNGTLYVQANSISGNVSGSGSLILGAVGLPTNFQLLSNSGTSQQSAIGISAGSSLDITNNTVEINYGSAPDPIAAVKTELSSAYNGGAWTGITGTAGVITSSTAAAGGLHEVLSVGYADGKTDNGTPAWANQIVGKSTLAADANLDGFVNSADLLAVVQNFNKTGTDWAHGNFTYIGAGPTTTSADLLLVVQNFNRTLSPAGSAGETDGGTTIGVGESAGVQAGPGNAQLPEPATAGLFAAGAAGILARRGRKTRVRPQQ